MIWALTDNLKKINISAQLIENVGDAVFCSYVTRIVANVAAIPICYRITSVYFGVSVSFDKHEDAKNHILKHSFDVENFSTMTHQFKYEATYSDGEIFERNNLTVNQALNLHNMVGQVSDYFTHYHTIESKK